jgi:hypothetical protein
MKDLDRLRLINHLPEHQQDLILFGKHEVATVQYAGTKGNDDDPAVFDSSDVTGLH